MNVKIICYLDVISSWCYWAEPAWAELKQRYTGKVEFAWKTALLDASSIPATREEEEWYFRRSGTIMRSPFMLSAGWYESGMKEYLAPNAVAEAAKDFGVTDDHVRLAIAHAALREGRKVGRWEEAVAPAAKAADLDSAALLAKAKSKEIEARVRASTAEFHSFQVNQRPAFLIEDSIGDRAVFSGLVTVAPLASTIEAMLHDVAAYISHAAHYGPPPSS
ncbi:MAG: DsbA family protein [Verrucomicrobia bacterium]|nr:DsbA family protein [Verrucomicrobiota bacterium]